MRSIVVQKAVVVNVEGNILLLRRSKTDVRRPLQWDLPGGMLELKEDLAQSVRREVKEESGLDVTDLLPIYATTEVRAWKDHEGAHTDSVTFIFYKASTKSGDVVLSFEHDKFQWAPLEKAINELEYDLHIKLLEYIRTNNLLS
jgi:8-oxo-dGTP pyrophosphatase MutT (NUDIX family)